MSVARARHERRLLETTLASLGATYYPSQANFVTAKLDLELLGPALAASGTVVRAGQDLGIAGWARISIGWAPQMAVLRGVLTSLLRPPAATSAPAWPATAASGTVADGTLSGGTPSGGTAPVAATSVSTTKGK